MSFLPLKGEGLRGLFVYPLAPHGPVQGVVLEIHTASGVQGASLTFQEASWLAETLSPLLKSPPRPVASPSGFQRSPTLPRLPRSGEQP